MGVLRVLWDDRHMFIVWRLRWFLAGVFGVSYLFRWIFA